MSVCEAASWWDALKLPNVVSFTCEVPLVGTGSGRHHLVPGRNLIHRRDGAALTIMSLAEAIRGGGFPSAYDVAVVAADLLDSAESMEAILGSILHDRGLVLVAVPNPRSGGGSASSVGAVATRLTTVYGLDLVGGGPFSSREPWADYAFVAAISSSLASHEARTLEPLPRPDRSLATLVGIVKDEIDLEEWIAFHAVIGFDSFVIYDHGSADPVAGRLAPLAASRASLSSLSIRVVDWNRNHMRQEEFVYVGGLDRRLRDRNSPQERAYAHFLQHYGDTTQWAAFLDADEFLVLHTSDGDLPAYLSTLGADVASVAIGWATFGSNGHDRRPSGLLTIEAYTRWGWQPWTETKRLVRTHGALFAATHSALSAAGRDVDVLGRPFHGDKLARGTALHDTRFVAAIHHYRVKSVEDSELKMRRGGGTTADRWTNRQKFLAFRDSNDLNDFEDRWMIESGMADRVRAWLAAAGGGDGGNLSGERSIPLVIKIEL